LNSTVHTVSGGNTGQCWYPPGADNLVAGNEAYNNIGYGIHAYSDEAGETSDRSVYRKNKFHNASGRGILVQPQHGSVTAADLLIYYNLLYRNSGASGFGTIRIIFDNAANVNILNNTVVSNANGGIKVGRTSDGTNVPVNTKAINNISVSNTGFQIEDNGTSTTATTNSWQIAGFASDFVGSATDDYHLGDASDAIDAGTDVSNTINSGTFALTPLTDYDGTSVPKNSVTDLGAFESGTAGEEPPDPPPPGAGVGNDNPSSFRRGRLRR
jgi:parallel beta-helix repeat protein